MVKVYESWGSHGLDSLDGLNSGLQFGSRRNYGFLFWEDFNRVETKSTNCTAQAAQGRVRNEDITTESPEVLPIRLIATGHVSNNKNDLVGGFKHFLFSIIYGIILPIDFHIFKMVIAPPTR